MKKPSKKRLSLLRLMKDYSFEHTQGWVYFPGLMSLQLEKYGLTLWNTNVIAHTEKAGLIERKKHGTFGRLTETGKQLLEKYNEP